MGRDLRFGVSMSYYGGASFAQAELARRLWERDIPCLQIRGCAYPEMARAEQVRQARLAGVSVLVLLDSHVEVSLRGLDQLVREAEHWGVAATNEAAHPFALECAAVRLDVLDAIISVEERRYGNSSVNAVWGSEKVPAVPVASPWHRNGESLSPGSYLTDGQAFMLRAAAAGFPSHTVWVEDLVVKRPTIRFRALNESAPVTNEPGSRFALCMPTFGRLDLDQTDWVAPLERAGMTVFQIHDCPWIDQARAWLAEQALAAGKGVFFLDHDILFHPNDVLRLCEQALERRSVVSGAYCMRASGKNFIGSLDVKPGPQTFFEGGDTLPAFYTGLGFSAIPAEILEDIELPSLVSDALGRQKIRPWFGLDCSTGFYAGEDVSFCNRVHDLSVQIAPAEPGLGVEWKMAHSGRPARVYLDTRVRLFHRGSYDYGLEDGGIVVPRIRSLRTVLTESRSEARAMLRNALEDIPIDVQLEARDFPAP